MECNLTRIELAPFEPLFKKITDDMLQEIKQRPTRSIEFDIHENSYEEGEKMFLKLLIIQAQNNISEVIKHLFELIW